MVWVACMVRQGRLYQFHDRSGWQVNLCYNSANPATGENCDTKETFTGSQVIKDIFLH